MNTQQPTMDDVSMEDLTDGVDKPTSATCAGHINTGNISNPVGGSIVNRVPKIDLQGRAPMDADLVSVHLLNVVSSDLKEWATSKAWPLSCYGPVKYLRNLDGFEEMSAEEIRLAGRLSTAEGRVEEYLTWLSELFYSNMEMINVALSLDGESRKESLENLAGFVIQGAGGIDNDKTVGSLLVPGLNDFDVEMNES